MKHKIEKTAMLRDNESNGCPFGLSISCACKNVGPLVDNMAPIEILGPNADSKEILQLKSANNFLFRWKHQKEKCKYAATLFPNKPDVVLCNWNTETAGIGESSALIGSPFYYKHFSGIGTDGLYSYPLGFYADNSIDRGMYQGMYSIEGIF